VDWSTIVLARQENHRIIVSPLDSWGCGNKGLKTIMYGNPVRDDLQPNRRLNKPLGWGFLGMCTTGMGSVSVDFLGL